MKILVVGGGGREHALAWKLTQSEVVTDVLVAPGNAGTAMESGVRNVACAADDVEALLLLAQRESVDLTVVGPEVPLVAGIVDRFQSQGLACFGPSQAAAQLEGSKAFSKEFLTRNDIPTARFESFTELERALDYVRAQGAPIVIKADGLAAGKGVVVAQSIPEAEQALTQMMSELRFAAAGTRVVVEEFIAGEEVSFICICDGKTAVPFATSQDHKARDEGDKGPNTGGMGAYSPAPIVDDVLERRIMAEVIEPTLDGMARDGAPYVGFLYAGLMITPSGDPKVIEFNCRFGDPEAQPLLCRLRTDLFALCQSALAGELASVSLEFDPRCALGVVIAAGGYPDDYQSGDVITGLDKDLLDTKVFHAGTRQQGDDVVTSGGRVLCVVGMGHDVRNAQVRAYERADLIGWRGRYLRKDIGHRAIARLDDG